jgi:hypothetical protein
VKQKRADLKKQIADLEKQRRPYPTASFIATRDGPAILFSFRRVDTKGPVMSPGVLTILAGDYTFTAPKMPNPAGAVAVLQSGWHRRRIR